jgi:hypothetical protein
VLVQRIVKAYEKYQDSIGTGRQMSLRLGDSAAEPPRDATEGV